MHILGISAFYHDSAAALVVDGRLTAAAQEERFTRRRHDAAFPTASIQYCLRQAGLSLNELDAIVFYDKPFLKFERLIDTFMAYAPQGLRFFHESMPVWFKEKLLLRRTILNELGDEKLSGKLLFSEHHLSHAASAFYPSPFEESAVLTLDGVGEWTTTSCGFGSGRNLHIREQLRFPHSLGLLYSAVTSYCGFKVNSGEYKLMGLAPYGKPRFAQRILDQMLDLKSDGSFRLNLEYFNFTDLNRMYTDKLHELFEGPARHFESPMEDRYKDVAASVQLALEEVLLKITRHLHRQTNSSNLCMAGGVALNCVANAKILKDGRFRRIWIQPAAGDAGGAIGAALAAYHLHFERPRVPVSPDGMAGAFLGPEVSQADTVSELRRLNARFRMLTDEELLTRVAQDLASGLAVGWFQGRMEFGPRALGGRSILADARAPGMQSTLNLKVKFRESFRPFAPSVLNEDREDWFDLGAESPYMLLVGNTRTGRKIPAVTHVDQSARVQTVHADTNPRYHGLLEEFKRQTGCSVLVNTSFNVRGEPIVCSVEDAFRCFMGTKIERLVIGNCYLVKEEQQATGFDGHKDQFAPD